MDVNGFFALFSLATVRGALALFVELVLGIDPSYCCWGSGFEI
jgi:hypothetical protein